MPVPTFSPVTKVFRQINFEKLPKPGQFRVLLRTTKQKFMPARPPELLRPAVRRRQEDVLARPGVGLHQMANIYRHGGKGPLPTIVVGGFVPDSTESVFLLKDLLHKHGSIYCVNYPRTGFNLDLLCAQLDDLVDEITLQYGKVPVVLSVSFGCGVVIDWLRRRREMGGFHHLAGLIFVSPVACVDDLLPEGRTKAATLLGRAMQPYLDRTRTPDSKAIERSRAIFVKMFEAGAQNKAALRQIMNAREAIQLRDNVMATIKSIDSQGACDRVGALVGLTSPLSYYTADLLPLSEVPTLVLYAEKEDSVVDASSPTRRVFETAHKVYFSKSEYHLICNPGGSPVQHASLIFHHANFRPVLGAFFKRLRAERKGRAA